VVEAVVEVNAAQKARMVRKIRTALGGDEGGKTIAVLGLAFKPETDDLREAASLTILPALMEHGATVRAHDPEAVNEARRLLPEVTFCTTPYEACDDADAVVLMTEWNEYRALDLEQIKQHLRSPVFVDLRNVYEPEALAKLGFAYYGVGRSPVGSPVPQATTNCEA
jgi:UDPglucose 6-dehydrogenase